MFHNIVAEKKFKGDCEAEPNQADSEGVAGGVERPAKAKKPRIKVEEHYCRCARHLMR